MEGVVSKFLFIACPTYRNVRDRLCFEHETKLIASSIGFVIGESIFGNVGLTPKPCCHIITFLHVTLQAPIFIIFQRKKKE